jgi:two-component system, OmpR family, response regulator
MRKRILIVEDDADGRHALVRLMIFHGYSIGTAATCAEALELIKTREFDVLLTDISLPDGDGREIARFFKAQAPSAPTYLSKRAIAVTGWDLRDETGKLAAGLLDAQMLKPFDIRQLVLLIEEADHSPLPPPHPPQALGISSPPSSVRAPEKTGT